MGAKGKRAVRTAKVSEAPPAHVSPVRPKPGPVVASYVSDFLKADMLHIYRQVTGQQRVTPWVVTHRREEEARFPFPARRLIVLPKPRLRWWRRFLSRHVHKAPWRLHTWEVRHAILQLTRSGARVLHIYFGHTAVHLLPLIKA